MGSIGPSGFAGADRRPRVSPSGLSINSMPSISKDRPHDRVRCQFADAPAKFLFTTTADDTIIGAMNVVSGRRWKRPVEIAAQYDFIVTHSTIWVYKNANLISRFRLSTAIQTISLWNRPDDKRQIPVHTRRLRMGKPEPGDEVVQTDDRGQIVERTELPPLVLPGRTTAVAAAYGNSRGTARAAGVSVYEERDNPGQPFSWRMVAIEVMVIGCISAVAAMLLMTRYDSRRGATPLWMAICFVMGIPGLLLLISLRQVVRARRARRAGAATHQPGEV